MVVNVAAEILPVQLTTGKKEWWEEVGRSRAKQQKLACPRYRPAALNQRALEVTGNDFTSKMRNGFPKFKVDSDRGKNDPVLE